jgi:hypothetical protein
MIVVKGLKERLKNNSFRTEKLKFKKTEITKIK